MCLPMNVLEVYTILLDCQDFVCLYDLDNFPHFFNGILEPSYTHINTIHKVNMKHIPLSKN